MSMEEEGVGEEGDVSKGEGPQEERRRRIEED
jgi:hypothetical protein